MDDFRNNLAARAIAAPSFVGNDKPYIPHPELVRLAEQLRNGRSLKEIAIRAWTFQDMNDEELSVHEAARFRTIYRRIIRHMNQAAT